MPNLQGLTGDDVVDFYTRKLAMLDRWDRNAFLDVMEEIHWLAYRLKRLDPAWEPTK